MEKEEIINDSGEESRTKSQEARTESQESSVAAEESTDTLYDISDESESNNSSDESDSPDDPEGFKSSEDTDSQDGTNAIEPTSDSDPARTEIDRMVSEMGAETLLQIIKGNRNAAIGQIIKEVEASQDRSLPSGASSAPSCTSIFDLAAMA